MRTILVTGGAGFIGSNFVHYIYNKYPEDKIIVLDLLTYAGDVENLPAHNQIENSRLEFWYGDIRNSSLVDSLMERTNIVVHFAAETHVTRSIHDNYHFFETDVLGTQVLVNSASHFRNNIERFIHISTSEVYGTAMTDKMSEDHPLLPLSPYASAKTGADRLVYSYWATYDLPVVIVRPFNNYGPRQHLEKAIPRFITSCILDEPLRVHGDGSAMRDWIYVQDTCEGLDQILRADIKDVSGEVINLGTEHSISVLEIAKIIVARMGKSEDNLTFVGERPGQVFRHTADGSKAERILGWKPTISFDDGIDKTIAWFIKNRPWWEKQLWLREIPIVSKSGEKELH